MGGNLLVNKHAAWQGGTLSRGGTKIPLSEGWNLVGILLGLLVREPVLDIKLDLHFTHIWLVQASRPIVDRSANESIGKEWYWGILDDRVVGHDLELTIEAGSAVGTEEVLVDFSTVSDNVKGLWLA